MTVQEIQYIIASPLAKDQDFEFLNSLIPVINGWYARLVKQRLERGGKQLEYESSFDAKLIKDSLYNLCDGEGCIILRTENTIPSPIHLNYYEPFRVSSITKELSFDFSTPEQYRFQKHNRYTGKSLKFFYINGYVYVTTHKHIKHINIRGIFLDDLALSQFDNCANCGIDREIPNDMANKIIESIRASDLRILTPQEDNGEIEINDKKT